MCSSCGWVSSGVLRRSFFPQWHVLIFKQGSSYDVQILRLSFLWWAVITAEKKLLSSVTCPDFQSGLILWCAVSVAEFSLVCCHHNWEKASFLIGVSDERVSSCCGLILQLRRSLFTHVGCLNLYQVSSSISLLLYMLYSWEEVSFLRWYAQILNKSPPQVCYCCSWVSSDMPISEKKSYVLEAYYCLRRNLYPLVTLPKSCTVFLWRCANKAG